MACKQKCRWNLKKEENCGEINMVLLLRMHDIPIHTQSLNIHLCTIETLTGCKSFIIDFSFCLIFFHLFFSFSFHMYKFYTHPRHINEHQLSWTRWCRIIGSEFYGILSRFRLCKCLPWGIECANIFLVLFSRSCVWLVKLSVQTLPNRKWSCTLCCRGRTAFKQTIAL